MSAEPAVVPLLLFEAAGCLMALPASEVTHLERRVGWNSRERPAKIAPDPSSMPEGNGSWNCFDLGEYFGGAESNGPWLQWVRGTRKAWLRVRRVVDVVPVAIAALEPMPALLRAQVRTRAFLAAGVRGDDVFLLIDPARLAV